MLLFTMQKMYMKVIIFLVLLSVVNSTCSSDWHKFKEDYNKQYSSVTEEAERKQIFLENVNRIRVYKQTYPNATFTLGINHLADRHIKELISRPKTRFTNRPKTTDNALNSPKLPDSLDWRTKGVVTPVKDQGLSGQVYAIPPVEIIESLYAIQKKQLISGSIARVIDCCPQTDDTFHCITKLGGICAAAGYPATTGQCLPNKCEPFAHFDKLMRLKNQNEDTMLTWIQNSTLYVGIDASQSSFEFYINGIYDDPSCSKVQIDHVMQLVGYGKTDSGQLYWICRNSWGVSWGEQGYVRILRGKNMCGIATDVVQVA